MFSQQDSESLEELNRAEAFKIKPQKISTPPEENVFDESKNIMTSSYEREEQKYVAEEKVCSKGKDFF